MKEEFDSKIIETKRDQIIKAEATFDALAYINLMRKKSPESLELNSSGELGLNISDGKKIFKDAEIKLHLTLEELMKYIEELMKAVEDILSK